MIFSKYEATGNDFILTQATDGVRWERLSKKLCDRHKGVGADGLIVVKNLKSRPEMIFFNADGSPAAMCGNGLRCTAAFCFHESGDREMEIMTGDGLKSVSVTPTPMSCRALVACPKEVEIRHVALKNNEVVPVFLVDTGVPHAVLADRTDLRGFAEKIRRDFDANVDFVSVVDKKTLRVTTFERGVGWTLSCGTGVAASAAVCFRLRQVAASSEAICDGGVLETEICANGEIWVGSKVNRVFKGETFEEE